MAIHLIDKAWRAAPYKAEKLLVLLALADWSNEYGICFPSYKAIAQKARITREAAIKIMQGFLMDGAIELVEDGSGRGNPRTYRLLPDAWDSIEERRLARAAEDEKGNPEPVKGNPERVIQNGEKGNPERLKGNPERFAYKEEPSCNRHEPSMGNRERERERAASPPALSRASPPAGDLPETINPELMKIFNRYYPHYELAIYQREAMSATMTDLVEADKCLAYCAANGVRPHRVGTMNDIYKSGDYLKPQRVGNGNGRHVKPGLSDAELLESHERFVRMIEREQG